VRGLTVGIAVASLVLVGCRGSKTPEQVVRAWSEARNSGDDERAADLFATNAKIIAGDSVSFLRTHDQAVAFMKGLGWCGPIIKLVSRDSDVTARFSLVTRAAGSCRGRGRERGSVFFRIRDGRIVVFDLIGA
jgi:hypothetical protein